MRSFVLSRKGMASLFAAALLLPAAGCTPVASSLDNPLPGAEAEVSPAQPFQVRLSNVEPSVGAWQWRQKPMAALSFKDRVVRPPVKEGVRQLEMFNFMGAKAGTEELTFDYAKPDGKIVDQITVKVAVR